MIGVELRGVEVELGGRAVLRGIDLDVRPGEVLALLGPNGAGKSTLLNVLAGDVAPAHGGVTIGERAVGDIRPSELARLRAVLPQENAVSFPFLVGEVIEMGRAPWARTPSADADAEAIARAVERTDVAHLLARPFPTLSGGERARVSLARVLAQRTPVLLLDEPTAALDLRHQEDVMRIARELAREGAAIAVVLHDLSLAGAWCDRLALLGDGVIQRIGSPREVLDSALLARVYGLEVTVVELAGSPHVVPVRATQEPGA